MLKFRTATLSDSQDLNDLVNSAYRGDSSKKGWTTEADLLGGQRTDLEKINEMIEDKNAQIEILFDEMNSSTILGCVYLKQENPGSLYFGMLTVRPTLQAQGLGKKLLEKIEQIAEAKGCHQIRMTVIKQRLELIEFYKRRGYKASGKSEEFPMNDPRFGIPITQDLLFLEFIKDLA